MAEDKTRDLESLKVEETISNKKVATPKKVEKTTTPTAVEKPSTPGAVKSTLKKGHKAGTLRNNLVMLRMNYFSGEDGLKIIGSSMITGMPGTPLTQDDVKQLTFNGVFTSNKIPKVFPQQNTLIHVDVRENGFNKVKAKVHGLLHENQSLVKKAAIATTASVLGTLIFLSHHNHSKR